MLKTLQQISWFDLESFGNFDQAGQGYASSTLFNKGNVVRGYIYLFSQKCLGKTLLCSNSGEIDSKFNVEWVFFRRFHGLEYICAGAFNTVTISHILHIVILRN